MKGMTTCKVCGRDFPLMKEEHYIARSLEKSGLASVISKDEARLYDAFDCPHCGCQNIVSIREREQACKCVLQEQDEQDEQENCEHKTYEHDGCVGCEYESLHGSEWPCSDCKSSHIDRYTPGKEEKS